MPLPIRVIHAVIKIFMSRLVQRPSPQTKSPQFCLRGLGDAVHKLKSLFFPFHFLILHCAPIYISHGIFGFLSLYRTKVR